MPPVVNAITSPTSISLTCGQDVTVATLMGITSIFFSCSIFNGSESSTMCIYKDNILISESFTLVISPASDDDFGTYSFRVSNPCGIDAAESRILQQGKLGDIAFC